MQYILVCGYILLSLNQNFIETGMTNAIWRNRTRAERGNSLYAWLLPS